MIGPHKTAAEIQAMRDGGRILATILLDLRDKVVPGVSEKVLDDWTAKEITRYGAIATYRTNEVNFPGSICISVNNQVVHSIPTNYILQQGDLVSFDLVLTYKGMKTDSAFTMTVGDEPTDIQEHLLRATQRSLYAGINAINGPTRIGDIGAAIEKELNRAKLGIVRDLVGHGIGHNMHQEPENIPNYGHQGTGIMLTPGTTIAIEPMTTLGSEKVILEDDGWTVSTEDGSLSAHFEHTVMVTENGVEILTVL
ncbi:MAG TPA: type I methionyl aminopeptidase [Candidatus Saccharimonadales bacterium]|jgi:methionyl aminopeptidase